MMAALMKNSITTASRLKNLLIGFTLIVLAGCAGQPFEPDTVGEIPSGPGVLSGEDGEFTIYDSEGGVFGKKKNKKDSETAEDNAEAEEFQEFQQWKKEAKEFRKFQEWKKTSRDSDEYREFLEWRKWKKYKEWEKSQQGSE